MPRHAAPRDPRLGCQARPGRALPCFCLPSQADTGYASPVRSCLAMPRRAVAAAPRHATPRRDRLAWPRCAVRSPALARPRQRRRATPCAGCHAAPGDPRLAFPGQDGRAKPRLAAPRRDKTGHDRRAPPCLAARAIPRPARPGLARTAQPRLDGPCQATPPGRAKKYPAQRPWLSLALTAEPCFPRDAPRRLNCLARPSPAEPCPAKGPPCRDCQALPCLAMPRQATHLHARPRRPCAAGRCRDGQYRSKQGHALAAEPCPA